MFPIGELSDGKLFARLSKHFISLIVTVRGPDGKKERFNYSGFVFLADGAWFFMTAGHAIVNLQQAVKAGYQVERWYLNDGFAGGKHDGIVPVDFAIDDWAVSYDPDEPSGADIAGIHIKNLHVLGLQTNGVIPLRLGDDFARLNKHGFDKMALLGIPSERVTVHTGSKVSLGLRMIPAEHVSRDEVAAELIGRHERIYAKVDLRHKEGVDIESVAGTSGGALFGIWISAEQQTYDYAAIGVQSGWHAPSQQIAAWPLDRLSKNLFELEGDSE